MSQDASARRIQFLPNKQKYRHNNSERCLDLEANIKTDHIQKFSFSPHRIELRNL